MMHSLACPDVFYAGPTVLWLLFTASILCLPLAYAMGQITGSEAMRAAMLSHPSVRARKEAKRLDESA